MDLITKSSDFTILIKELERHKFVTLDTEFLRDKTYYPHFCLLQIGTPNKAYAVDVLSKDIDLSLLKSCLVNKKIVKVFHSCKQDIEILYRAVGVMPEPVFDTQIAAAFCGIDEMASYDVLCRKLLKVQVDKSHRVTDWSVRPLSREKIQYALNDVIYLVQLYQILNKELSKQNKINWSQEYMKQFSDPNFLDIDSDQVWQRINIPKIPSKAKHIYKIVAVWREGKAKELDLPRRKFMNDYDMTNVSLCLSGVNKNIVETAIIKQYKDEIAKFIEQFKEANSHDYLSKKVLNFNQRKQLSLLKNLLSSIAASSNIARHLIAKNADLIELVFSRGRGESVCTRGWRNEIYGKYAIQILDK